MVWLFMQLHQLTASHNNPIDTNSYITSIIQRKLCLELLQGKMSPDVCWSLGCILRTLPEQFHSINKKYVQMAEPVRCL